MSKSALAIISANTAGGGPQLNHYLRSNNLPVNIVGHLTGLLMLLSLL